jgi:peptide/nickel transport system substrate-binding protein
MKRVRLRLVAIGLLSIAVALLASSAMTQAKTVPTAADTATGQAHRCVVAAGSGDQPFTRNFNPFNAGAHRDFTRGGIYESLIVSSAVGGGRVYNILAEKVSYAQGGRAVNIILRRGARWSNGRPVTIRDVHYSLTAGRQDKAMDRINLTSPTTNIASVRITGPRRVTVRFKAVDSTFVGSELSDVFVVPQRIWSRVRNVTDFTNPNPVGSGPFNRISRFNGQTYILERNPRFWMRGFPKVQCIQRIASASNDAALLQIQSGQADWTHNFVPNVERAYIARDPRHFHAAYIGRGLPVSLFFDLTKYPYSLPAFRKGISNAIDRAKVVRLGEYGYAPAVNALGIERIYPNWIDSSLTARARQMAAFNPAAARRTFTEAGFTYRGNALFDPRGNRVSFSMHVIGGWSDWVASLNIIADNLRDVGIDARVQLEPDWGAWQPGAMSTRFVTLLWNYGGEDITPYRYFFSHFDPASNLGPGVDASATGNWEHYSNAQGAALLRQFRGTLNRATQRRIAGQLQRIWLDNLPAVHLFVGPRWSTYSTRYFTGFPTYRNTYVDPIFTEHTQVEVILLRLRRV